MEGANGLHKATIEYEFGCSATLYDNDLKRLKRDVARYVRRLKSEGCKQIEVKIEKEEGIW
jgi:hypothetical protein